MFTDFDSKEGFPEKPLSITMNIHNYVREFVIYFRLALIVRIKLVVKLKYIYTASKVKHHLNIFQEKTVKLSKHDIFLLHV